MYRQLIRLVVGPAALLIAVVACQGSPASNSALPTGGTTLGAPPAIGGSSPVAAIAEAKKDRIVSSCGRRIHIVVAGIIDCRFREKGRRDNEFRLENHTSGIILISPSSGTRATTFTITGLVTGSGYFIVKGTRRERIKVRVRVTL